MFRNAFKDCVCAARRASSDCELGTFSADGAGGGWRRMGTGVLCWLAGLEASSSSSINMSLDLLGVSLLLFARRAFSCLSALKNMSRGDLGSGRID